MERITFKTPCALRFYEGPCCEIELHSFIHHSQIAHLTLRTQMRDQSDEIWVFGYGSLMWRPGFRFLEHAPAMIYGVHRSLCIYSHVHRGTPEKPGLVMGLNRGGACRGVAYRVAAEEWDGILGYLREREQATAVYLERWMPAHILAKPRRRVRAITYVADNTHHQFADDLPISKMVELVRQGHGQSGPNIDYVLNTIEHLEELGVHDPKLHALAVVLSEDG